MPLYDDFPYTNFHALNLDWIIKEMKELVDSWDRFGVTVSAEAHTASDPEVTVTGDLKNGLNFDFGIVRGPRGTTGPQGPQGEQGPAGNGLEILDIYPTLAALQAAHPTGSPGDAYLVGSGGNYTLYIWSSSSNAWSDGGSLTSPSPSSAAPAMDGVAAAGSSLLYSRGDHVHPADASKLDKSSSDGVYAVESGAQVMITASDTPVADAIVKYDSVGDIHGTDVYASSDLIATGNVIAGADATITGDVSATDITASGVLSGDTISIKSNNILNSDALDSMASSGASYRPMAKIVGTDALQLEYDASNIPDIKLDVLNYNDDGTISIDEPKVYFTSAFTVNTADYLQRRIDLKPASASQLGGVKEGTGISIASDGTISASASAFTMDLLWTNASPTSSFSPQTISIDLSTYKDIIVQFRIDTSANDSSFTNFCPYYDTYSANQPGQPDSSAAQVWRKYTVSATGIEFNNGGKDSSNNNEYAIPLRIFGIK